MPKITKCPESLSQIRSRLRALGHLRRDELSVQERRLFSQLACAHIVHYLEQIVEDFSQTVLAGYWPILSEIDPRPLFDFVLSRGGHLALPAVIDSTRMVFRAFSATTPLEPMRFGTFGPGANQRVINPSIVIVPLSAFDNQCHRLGYGKGYYDRAIKNLQKSGHHARLLGLGFSCQKVESIPCTDHDLIVEGVFTEKGFFKC
ncbi:5-formyltetrahydrofolate cyclo-ligase [Bartonella australis AUST/NH1]|uniref:5-formyltetrahydrofolate cyclo-ligase n=1 Tax=Bartonella australis (strain Aust/NH1) TaxID=1094489 RepID=M1PED3_BARAA|nr:5-formyltetrahydrofolate cyclo-ligase [Bartonella australis]AGF74971.1 5-formyltetrahydrofolate cyclo-ligase [Bartonella australis AUST/NH1]